MMYQMTNHTMPTLHLNDRILFFIIVSNVQYSRKINGKLELFPQSL